MAYYVGYVDVPHTSYDEWKSNTNGNGYNIDGYYGCQCWDFASLFWRNLGFPQGYPLITASSAYTMWENRESNISFNGVTYFDLIYTVNQIKKGDVIVFQNTLSNPYGHVGFADVDYDNWTPDPNYPYEFPILSENNGGTPDPDGGAYVNVHGYDIRLFMGAFRYRNWIPQPEEIKHKFPFVLYARKLRNRQMGL